MSPEICAASQAALVNAQPISSAGLSRFEAVDARYEGKSSIVVAQIRPLDGATCTPSSPDGVLSVGGTGCHDISAAVPPPASAAASGGDPLMFHSWPLYWFPPAAAVHNGRAAEDPARAAATALAHELRAALHRNQFVSTPTGCQRLDDEPWRSLYYVRTVPLIGFASQLEYVSLFLARAVAMGSQLVFGPRASLAWSSAWFCGQDRSPRCYFNLSSCCAAVALDGRELELPRRRNPLNLGLPGFERYGSAWVSAQLAGFLFSTMNARTRAALAERRAGLVPRASPPHLPPSDAAHVPTIGMHIRGGDACHARRFCPSNLTATWFAHAAEMRRRYGATRLLVATDDARAARLCRERVLGFDCHSLPIGREKYDDKVFIERRVSAHADGELSGSTVALDALADLDMLADCDYFVLVLRSAMSRVAYALSLARKGRHAPLVSLQLPWSSAGTKHLMKGRRNAKGGKNGMRRAGGSGWRGRGGRHGHRKRGH